MQSTPREAAPPTRGSFRATLLRVLFVQAVAIGALAAIQAIYHVP